MKTSMFAFSATTYTTFLIGGAQAAHLQNQEDVNGVLAQTSAYALSDMEPEYDSWANLAQVEAPGMSDTEKRAH